MEKSRLASLSVCMEEIPFVRRASYSNFLSAYFALRHCLRSFQSNSTTAKRLREDLDQLEELCKSYQFRSPLEIAVELLDDLKRTQIPDQLFSIASKDPIVLVPVTVLSEINSKITRGETNWNIQAIVFQKSNCYVFALRTKEEWTLSSLTGKHIYSNWNMFSLGCKELDVQPILAFYKIGKRPLAEFTIYGDLTENQDIVMLIRRRNKLGLKTRIQMPSTDKNILSGLTSNGLPELRIKETLDVDTNMNGQKESIMFEDHEQKRPNVQVQPIQGGNVKEPFIPMRISDDSDSSSDSSGDSSEKSNSIPQKLIIEPKHESYAINSGTNIDKKSNSSSSFKQNEHQEESSPVLTFKAKNTEIKQTEIEKNSLPSIEIKNHAKKETSLGTSDLESFSDLKKNPGSISKADESSNLSNPSLKSENPENTKLQKTQPVSTAKRTDFNIPPKNFVLESLPKRGNDDSSSDSSSSDESEISLITKDRSIASRNPNIKTNSNSQAPFLISDQKKSTPPSNLPNISMKKNVDEIKAPSAPSNPLKKPEFSESSSESDDDSSSKSPPRAMNRANVSYTNNKLSRLEVASESDHSADSGIQVPKLNPNNKKTGNPLVSNKKISSSSSSSSSDKKPSKNIISIDPSLETYSNKKQQSFGQHHDEKGKISLDSQNSSAKELSKTNQSKKDKILTINSSSSSDSQGEVEMEPSSDSVSYIPQLNSASQENRKQNPTIESKEDDSLPVPVLKPNRSAKPKIDASKGEDWDCTFCTFNNEADVYICEMCGKTDKDQYKRFAGQDLR